VNRSTEATAAARGSVLLVAMHVASRGTAAVFAVVAARALDPATFGRYSVALATVLLFAVLANAGTTAAITRTVSRGERSSSDILRDALPVNLTLGTIAAVGAWAVASRIYGGTVGADVAIAALSLPLQSATTSFWGALDGANQVAERARLGVLPHLIQFGGGAVVLGAPDDVRIALWFVPLAALVTLAVTAHRAHHTQVWRLDLRVDLGSAVALVRMSTPFAVLGLISAVASRLDLMLITGFVDRSETAFYDVGVRLTEALAFIATALGAPLLVVLNRRRAQGDPEGTRRAVTTSARVLAFTGLGLSVTVVGSAHTLVDVLGSGYSEAVSPLMILGGQLWLTYRATLLGTILMSSERIGRIIPVAAAITSTTIALDLLLIPSYGADGAAVASALGAIVACVGFAVAGARWGEPAVPWPSPLLLLVGIASAAAAYVVDTSSAGAASLVVGPVLFTGGALATRSISPADLRWLRRSVGSGDADHRGAFADPAGR
jgi:O-antigen/teichoic acid export membrane protein